MKIDLTWVIIGFLAAATISGYFERQMQIETNERCKPTQEVQGK